MRIGIGEGGSCNALRSGEAGVGAFEDILGGEEGLHNNVLIDEWWHVSGRGGVRSLSSLVYTPHKQRGITRIDFGSGLV